MRFLEMRAGLIACLLFRRHTFCCKKYVGHEPDYPFGVLISNPKFTHSKFIHSLIQHSLIEYVSNIIGNAHGPGIDGLWI